MQVRITLRREQGRWRPPYGMSGKATGRLRLTFTEAEDRRVPCLILNDADRLNWPLLFEPRCVTLQGNSMRWLGFEYIDRAWHMQEWDCKVLS